MTAALPRRAAALALLLLAGAAQAHSPVPGVGHFYGGMLHPLVVPAHLIALAACGLWLGPRWPAQAPVLGLGALAALAAAADRGAPRPWPLLAALALGAALGLDSWPDGLSGRPLVLSLLGTWLTALLLPGALVLLAEAAQRPWMRIALRVLASWLAAAAVLVLVLALRSPTPAA